MDAMNSSNKNEHPSNSNNATQDNDLSHDCNKLCSVPVGGARSKVKQHFCNIPNGSAEACGANNTSPDSQGPSCSKFVSQSYSTPTNISNNIEKKINSVETYLTNNVDDHDEVDKCPSKVSNRQMEETEIHSGYLNGYSRQSPRKSNYSDEDSSSGNEGDEGMSADDCCIYTYKGDQFADLPASFFTLDRIANGADDTQRDENVRDVVHLDNERSRASSSPEMDFLEMDFDPGPSLEQDSEEDFEYGREGCVNRNENEDSPIEELPSESAVNNLSFKLPEETAVLNNVGVKVENDLSRSALDSPRNPASPEPVAGSSNVGSSVRCKTIFPHSLSTDSNLCYMSGMSTRNSWPAKDLWGHHVTSGDLCSPRDGFEVDCNDISIARPSGESRIQGDLSPDARKYNLHSTFYHCMMAKKLIMNKETNLFSDDDSEDNNGEPRLNSTREGKSSIERAMIWTEQEACNKQVTQISTSACGATSVINVLLALNVSFSVEKVKEGVSTRLRAESAPLPAYLFSRSNAGATHADLIRGITLASEIPLYARFFHMYPERNFSLSKWLSHWIQKGAVPIATLNLQHGVQPGNPIPDAWHHQMVFGVSSRGIYLTNPIECVEEDALWQQLSSPSILKIRRNDVLNRWNPHTDLRPLMDSTDSRWRKLNVLGQVINAIRESTTAVQGRVITEHVTIPASYTSGITLVIPKNSPSYKDLVSEIELPLYTLLD